MQLARRPARPGPHLRHARADKIARLQHQQLRPVEPADAVAQRAVLQAHRIVVRDRPNPRDMVADQDPKPVAACRFFRRDQKFRLMPVALHAHDDRLGRLDAVEQRLRARGLLAACRQDHVAAPQPRALGRRVRLHLGDHQTLGIQLDADRISSRHERPPRGQCLAAERQQQAQGHQRGRYFFMKKLLHVLILSPKVSAPLSWPFRRERNRV